MHRIAAVVFALTLSASASAATIQGAWSASLKDSGRLQLNVSYERSQNGHTAAVSSFTGLSESAIRAVTSTPVQFSLQREAGSLVFDGAFKGGHGGGQFTFTPNANYYDSLRSMGVRVDSTERRKDNPDATLLSLALLDVSTGYIRSLRGEGYDVPLSKYIAMRVFKITPELIREFRALGFRNVFNVEGGIAAWSDTVDASIPRY